MSSKSRKKLQPQIKRIEVTDCSGWTHVVHGRKGIVDTKNLDLQLGSLQIVDSLSLEQVEKNHVRDLRLWKESECWKNLAGILEREIVSSKQMQLTNCVCLGLGSLSAGRLSSRYELAALVAIMDLLGERHLIQNVVFQDPVFNNIDEAFLSSLGYSVVSTPSGIESIDENTFLFAPHLENDIFTTAVQHTHPALCIGNGNALSDASLHSSLSDSKAANDTFLSFVEAMESRPMPTFDKDTWCQFTSIYWWRGGVP